MADNRRKLFVNNRIRNFFIFYALFSIFVVVLFLGWEVFIEILISFSPEKTAHLQLSRGFPTVVKVSLLLLWGMFSFLLSYTYLDARFLGIFNRIDDFFKSLIKNNDQTLKLRGKDDFSFMSESFNKMHNMFKDRISSRRSFVETLSKKIEDLPNDAPDSEINELIQEIDEELTR